MTDKRCPWCLGDSDYEHYHDTHWGRPCFDDQTLFEFLVLEGAQAGLSWISILKRRAAYQAAFHQFDIDRVATMTEADVERLIQDSSIIRNRRKIESAIKNARAVQNIQHEFGSFSAFLWAFVDNQQVRNEWREWSEVPAQSPLSEQVSRALKKCGCSFVGPVIIYSYLQAMGLINDHLIDCPTRAACYLGS